MSNELYTSGQYGRKHPDWHAEHSPWKARRLFDLLSDEWLATNWPRRRLRVAEVGCGFGGVLAELCAILEEKGVECQGTGYDISPQAVHEAALRHPRLRFCVSDLSDVADRYDLGLIVDVLEHVQDPETLLTQARERFNWLLLHIPLDEHWYGRLLHGPSYHAYLRSDRGHIHCFTRKQALELIQKAGLRVRSWRYTKKGTELYRHDPASGRSAPLVYILRLAGMRLFPDLCVRVLGGASLGCLCRAV